MKNDTNPVLTGNSYEDIMRQREIDEIDKQLRKSTEELFGSIKK